MFMKDCVEVYAVYEFSKLNIAVVIFSRFNCIIFVNEEKHIFCFNCIGEKKNVH